jgi:hypothetical protein
MIGTAASTIVIISLERVMRRTYFLVRRATMEFAPSFESTHFFVHPNRRDFTHNLFQPR